MANNGLEVGAGGPPAPAEPKANPLSVKRRPPWASARMTGLGDEVESARGRFSKMKEAETQAMAILDEMGGLNALGDTVTSQDVVKGFAGIVAAGVPAVTLATILADMPEQGQALQAWVKQQFEHAITAEQKVSQVLNESRHQLLLAGLHHVIGHSAEAHHNSTILAGPPAGSA